MTKFDHFSPLLFRIIDASVVFVCAYIAYFFRFDTFSMPGRFLDITIVGVLLVVLFTSYKNAYVSWRGHYGFQLASRLTTSWSLAGAALLTILIFSHQGTYFSRLWLGYWWVLSLSGALSARAIVYGVLAGYRARGGNLKSVALVGHSNSISKVEKTLTSAQWAGYEVRERIYTETGHENLDERLKSISSKSINEIWLAMPLKDGEILHEAMFSLRNHTQNIRYIPDVGDLRLLNHKISDIAGLQIIDMSTSPLDGLSVILKRAEDLILGIIIFVMILPLMLFIATAVKLTSKGPILFKQHRHGIDGKPIKVYKFRSMKIHTEKEGQVTQATKNDPRLTPIGGFLRKSSLDELPQFFNVLQGRMSIVGPRPHAIAHNDYYKELVESYMRRHKVKPGITGWAQVNGLRGETDTIEKMERRVEYDLYYIDNWSIWFDIKIVLITILKGFFSKNAY